MKVRRSIAPCWSAMTVLVSALVPSACVQNHDILAAQPEPAGAGGAVAQAMPTAGGAGGAPAAPEDSGPPPIQPEGPRTLTVVNGVVDSPWVALCFAPIKAGVERPVTGAPVPGSGLLYGGSAQFDSLTGIDLTADGVRPYLVAGAGPSAVAGLDCGAIVARAHPTSLPQVAPPDAAPPPPDASESGAADAASSVDASVSLDATIPLDASKTSSVEASTVDANVPIPLVRFAALPVIPSGQLAVLHGYLLVLSGCVGGPGVTDSAEQSVCGSSYSPATPTLGPELVAPSRAAPSDRVALAFLNGTPAFSPCDVRLSPSKSGDSITVAQNVGTGALRPRTPLASYGAQDIASMSPDAAIQVYPRGSSQAAYDEPWQTTLNAGNLDGLANGKAYTLILLGPSPGFTAQRWWNGPLVTVVKN